MTNNSLIFNKYYMCNLLYMLVTNYQNKMLYNIIFSSTNFVDFLEDFMQKQYSSKNKQKTLITQLTIIVQFIVPDYYTVIVLLIDCHWHNIS